MSERPGMERQQSSTNRRGRAALLLAQQSNRSMKASGGPNTSGRDVLAASGTTAGGGGGGGAGAGAAGGAPSMTLRARRRREEAVRRLVADVVQTAAAIPTVTAASAGNALGIDDDEDGNKDRNDASNNKKIPTVSSSKGRDGEEDIAAIAYAKETQQWKMASTVATALERGLDRDLHAGLVQESKDNASKIGQICHHHADVFLASVAKVAALGEPCADLADGLKEAHRQLEKKTAGPMQRASKQWEDACQSYAKARTLHLLVNACQQVAIDLEKARNQASLGRPRAALSAVEKARKSLATPLEDLFAQSNMDPTLWKAATTAVVTPPTSRSFSGTGGDGGASSKKAPGSPGEHKEGDNDRQMNNPSTPTSAMVAASGSKRTFIMLEQTPFGQRALRLLPKIETEVLMNARRNLNRWFLSLRSEGDGAKVGRAVLRRCAFSQAVGTGSLGHGGLLPSSYVWRAKTADNLLSRLNQSGKVARAVRLAYWFDRDALQEAERLEHQLAPKLGVERRVEAIAAAMGWYRCWPDGTALLVEPSEWAYDGDGSTRSNLSGSRHGLRGSRHGLSGSRHGLGGSKHGRTGRSLGFRATTSSRSQAFQDLTSTLTTTAGGVKPAQQSSRWAELILPPVLSVDANSQNQKDEDEKLAALSESVHPVRRAELAFNLLGRSEEFIQYYEQNRFGEIKIGGDGSKDGEKEKRSALSSLTGDDVSVGTDRIFFAKTLAHLNASVVGFSAVEAALELGNFVDEDEEAKPGGKTSSGGAGSNSSAAVAAGGVGTMVSASRFRESSERYERALISELGQLIRARSSRATMAELVRAAALMLAFKASLKIAHPSSSTRRHDSELMAMDVDILVKTQKTAKDEQMRATGAIVADDNKIPMLVIDAPYQVRSNSGTSKKGTGIPDPEDTGLPFGLINMKQVPQKADVDFQEQSRTSFNRAAPDEAFTFSSSVPVTLRALHARAIAIASFALTLEELGQKFPDKKGSPAAGFVLDCVEECIHVTAIAMKDSDNVVEEGSVEKAVQVMANIAALQHTLPRFFGTLMRGMCHIGLIRAEDLEETFSYAEKTLKGADKACDSQVGSTYSLVYEICRNKIDSHINYALDNFNWIAKSARETPNAYCEGLIGYLRSVFASLGPMDEGSRAGLHFSCCGHVSERLVRLLSGKPGDTSSYDDSGIPPISRIDAFGIKNLALDCEEFERFADGLGIPQLRDCFNELKVLTTVMLDKELPVLLLPENSAARRRKYPILSLEKVGNILEKYQGTGLGEKLMGGGASRNQDFLFIDKKEVSVLLKYVRSQGY